MSLHAPLIPKEAQIIADGDIICETAEFGINAVVWVLPPSLSPIITLPPMKRMAYAIGSLFGRPVQR